MAIDATEMHRRNRACFDPSVLEAIGRGENPFAPERLIYSHTAEDSKAINDERGVIILAGSGMCQGGRVMHHLKHHLWRSESHVVVAGFQARGSRGRALVDGARKVRIFGEDIAVRARIHTVGGFSAHGGQSELTEWVANMLEFGSRVVLVHGEPEKRAALANHLRARSPHPILEPGRGDSLSLRRRGEPVVFEPTGHSEAIAR